MVDVKLKITLSKDLKLSNIPQTLKAKLIRELTIPNPKWIENARMGRWNRNVPKQLHFFHRYKDTLWIPRGYLRQLIMLCRHSHISYHINDLRRSLPPVIFSFRGELKPFQKNAVHKMLTRDFGTLNSPTGSGKTVMGLFMIAQRQQPALVVVHTKDLAYQWVEQITHFLNIPEPQIGLIGSGKKQIGDAITVALVQSLYRCADVVSKRVGHIIVDECHRTPSRTFTDAVTEFDARFMLGLSATPFRRDNLSNLIFWHLGDVHHSVDKSLLIQEGHVLQAEIILRETDFEPYHDPANSYSKMLLELTMDDGRNHLIASDVFKEVQKDEGVCLVLSDRKRHCETLLSLLRYKHRVKADLLTGDLSNEQRQRVLQRVKAGLVPVVVATGQLVGEGFDCPDLTTLFLATPIRFSGRVLQYLGRVLRPATDKNSARVYDYVDVKVGVLQSAAKHRQKVYADM
jgi:superfamily II DNA or RNA helicase